MSSKPQQPNRQKQKKKKTRQRPRRKTSRTARAPRLSRCAAQYAATIQNPFDVHGVGVPTLPNAPSLKAWTFSRGSFSTQTSNGFGFIFANPRSALANDRPCVWFSNAAGALTATSRAAGSANSNSSYTDAQFSPTDLGMRFRIVSAGLRIRYNGTNLNKGGSVWSLQHPTHNDVVPLTLAQASGLNVAKENRPGDKWITVNWCPLLVNDLDYLGNLADTPAPLLHVIQAPNAVALTFDYELFVNFEVNGSPVRGMTITPNDPVGYAAVSNAMGATPKQAVHTDQEAHKKSFFQSVETALMTGISGVGQGAMNYIGTESGKLLAQTTGQYLANTAMEYLPYLTEAEMAGALLL